MDQTSRTPTATFHTLPQPDAVPVIVTPLTVSCAPGEFFDTFFLPITSALTSSRPSDNFNVQRGIATPQSASIITQSLSTDNQIPQSIPNIAATLQTGDKLTGSPPTPDPSSMSSPTIIPVFHSGTIHAEFHSSVDSALVQRDNIWHPLGSPSSFLTTAHSGLSLQIASVLDAHTTMRSSPSTPSMQSNTRDIAHSISMVVSGHENPSVPPTPTIAGHTSPLGGHQDG